jgi:redox-sensitive bicupin YhaK (pirin superfamily)
MANTVLHKASTRGHADHGWLNAWHSFSFAGYYDPARVHFGALRVLNDDTVAAGMGFGMHPHDNMEIITIPLLGAVQHQDSMGNKEIVSAGEIQVMSAGTGIYHSEINPNKSEALKLLQIWVIPKIQGVKPRYGQMALVPEERHNILQQIVSPDSAGSGMWIHQDAWFHIGKFDSGVKTRYDIKQKGNGVYAFVISGQFKIEDVSLESRDGLGISEADSFELESMEAGSEILLLEVPMLK